MKYLIDKPFPFGLEKYLLNEEGINGKGLEIIAQIQSETICDNSNELKKFFDIIDSKCKDKRLWVLFGSDDSKSWLPLQLASVYAEKRTLGMR